MKPRSSPLSNIVSTIIIVLAIALAGIVVWQRTYIVDTILTWQYEPSQPIVSMTEATTMTDTAKRYFYASHPVLDPAEQFNTHCSATEKDAAVLGCYTNRKIYLFDITASELEGIKEVSAAHEMLHAAYDRLSESKRSELAVLLEVEAKRLEADSGFQDRMKAYADVDQDERMNEFHSIFATEVADLSEELEEYYRQYFTDRSVVVAMHERYSSIFRNLKAQAEDLAAELDRLATTINRRAADYKAAVVAFEADAARFNTRANNGDFASEDAFRNERTQLLGRQASLQALYDEIRQLTQEYETKRSRYNDIARHLTSLSESIDSTTVAPVPEV